jgi:hypothetical protein
VASFEIEEELGRGGMEIVYRALDLKLGRAFTMVQKMEISADIPQRTITIEVSASDNAITFIEEAKTNNGFMIPLSDRPEPFSTFTFHLHASGGFELSFDAKLLQLLEPPGGGQQGAFQLLDWDGAKDQELARKAVAARAGDDPAPEGETRGASPIFRIKKMDPGERARLALRADRAERQILCRDTTPQVLLNMLSNPRVEAQNVLAIVKSTYANGGLLQRIAKDRRWASNAEILTAIVRNPKTPTPMAIRLLEHVPTRELRQMARMGALRENVRSAAFRLYTKRTSRR